MQCRVNVVQPRPFSGALMPARRVEGFTRLLAVTGQRRRLIIELVSGLRFERPCYGSKNDRAATL